MSNYYGNDTLDGLFTKIKTAVKKAVPVKKPGGIKLGLAKKQFLARLVRKK